MSKANRTQMKEINKNIIRTILRERKKATKPELAAFTDLSVVTVNTLISEMVAVGEVMEGDMIPSNGGRPSMQYIYNGDFKKAIIIYGHEDQNQDLFHMLIINTWGKCIEHKKAYIKNIMTDSFDLWIEEAFKAYENICTILFGLPGAEKNGVIYVHDYPGIVGDQFLSYYQQKYNVPVIYENDINATIYGYYTSQTTNALQTAVGLYYPRIYGPGAGIVIKGEIYKGCKNFAGEVGSIPLHPSWNEVDYSNSEEVVEMLSQIVVVFSCVLAPECMVFYGDFLTDDILKKLQQRIKEILHGNFMPDIKFKKDLEEDFEYGLIQMALNEIKRREGIAEWY